MELVIRYLVQYKEKRAVTVLRSSLIGYFTLGRHQHLPQLKQLLVYVLTHGQKR